MQFGYMGWVEHVGTLAAERVRRDKRAALWWMLLLLWLHKGGA